MSTGIRTIHDAIDIKVNRLLGVIREKRSKRASEIEKNVYSKMGVIALLDKLEAITGDRLHIHNHDDSPLGKALKAEWGALKRYDELSIDIQRLAEDAHIKVVMGDKELLLNQLDKSLASMQSTLSKLED